MRAQEAIGLLFQLQVFEKKDFQFYRLKGELIRQSQKFILQEILK